MYFEMFVEFQKCFRAKQQQSKWNKYFVPSYHHSVTECDTKVPEVIAVYFVIIVLLVSLFFALLVHYWLNE